MNILHGYADDILNDAFREFKHLKVKHENWVESANTIKDSFNSALDKLESEVGKGQVIEKKGDNLSIKFTYLGYSLLIKFILGPHLETGKGYIQWYYIFPNKEQQKDEVWHIFTQHFDNRNFLYSNKLEDGKTSNEKWLRVLFYKTLYDLIKEVDKKLNSKFSPKESPKE